MAKSAGPAKRHWASVGTNGGITCEICYKNHPPSEEGHLFMNIQGKQIVMDCCGKIVDDLYDQFGLPFALAIVDDFGESPLDPQFGHFRQVLRATLAKVARCAKSLFAEAEQEASQVP